MALRPRPWLPLGALALFIAEALTFIALGQWLGYGWAVLVVVLTSLAGLVLVRREGLRAWRGFRQAVETGQPPGRQVTDGVVGLGGAALLTAPGLLTGLAGLLLLVPPVRPLARARVQARAQRRMPPGQAGQMFGPRRVKVWQHDTHQTDWAPEDPSQVVEGELIDPEQPPDQQR